MSISRKKKLLFVTGMTAAVAGLTVNGYASSKDGPPPPPPWVQADGVTVDLGRLPDRMPVVGRDGRPVLDQAGRPVTRAISKVPPAPLASSDASSGDLQQSPGSQSQQVTARLAADGG